MVVVDSTPTRGWVVAGTSATVELADGASRATAVLAMPCADYWGNMPAVAAGAGAKGKGKGTKAVVTEEVQRWERMRIVAVGIFCIAVGGRRRR